jgi:hypothetical protein
MTSGAGANHVASMLNGNVILQQSLADRGSRGRLDHSALWAVFTMGENNNLSHGLFVSLLVLYF